MPGHAPQVVAFVENFVFYYLDAAAKSQQFETRYNELPPHVKGATTRQVRKYAKKVTGIILDNCAEDGDLSELDDDSFIRDAITTALKDDD